MATHCVDCGGIVKKSVPRDLAAKLRASRDLDLRIRLALMLGQPETDRVNAAVAAELASRAAQAESDWRKNLAPPVPSMRDRILARRAAASTARAAASKDAAVSEYLRRRQNRDAIK